MFGYDDDEDDIKKLPFKIGRLAELLKNNFEPSRASCASLIEGTMPE